jgi:hypothetical protein
MQILALLLLGTLTGNELAVSAFVHPAISKLPDAAHAASAQAIARIYGKYAPFWYAATIITLILLALRPSAASNKTMLVVSAAFSIVALVFSLVGPVPINNRIVGWNLNDLPTNWKQERARWDTLHAIRVGILLASLLALALGTTSM